MTINKKLDEEWRDVLGYEGIYQVSNLGRVKTVRHTRVNILGIAKTRKSIIHKQNTGRFGHKYVGLSNNGLKSVKVHTMVLEAFVCKRPEGYVCRHLDGVPDNNHVENLAWGTPRQNSNDRRRHGTLCLGSKNPNAKLTDEIVGWIRENYKLRCRKHGQAALANKFGVSRSCIHKIIQNQSWIPQPQPRRNRDG